MSNSPRPIVLTILDGWGHSEKIEANAIAAAEKPAWDRLWADYAHSFIECSGPDVGLPQGQMGNSEVGHLNLGAGRVVHQDYTRVTQAIEDGSFADNEALTTAVDRAVAGGGAVHLIGLLSPGGVHSHEKHIHAMARLAAERGAREIYMHAILDGRDMPPRSAAESLQRMDAVFADIGCGRTASVIGRYYAMDRDKRWDRVRVAYDLYTQGKAEFEAANGTEALEMAYARDESDEFVKATRVVPDGQRTTFIGDGDSVIFMNYRADRAREITLAFTAAEFDGFEREVRPELADYASLTRYHKDFDVSVAFPPVALPNVLGEYLSRLGLRQLRVAETEKYAHVTFFFNGGEETPFPGEERILIPSPKVATYDLQPEMSADEVTDRLVEAIAGGQHDLIICNYANADMVGHSGNFDATVKAIEAIDRCLGRLATALREAGGELLVTADHGNAEQMADPETGQAHTAHTTNLVPLLYMGRGVRRMDDGLLSDIAPTVLALMGLEPPPEMTGKVLIEIETQTEAQQA